MIKDLDDVANNRVVGMVVGPSGVGKTSLAGTLHGRTLIASAESGLLALKNFPKEIRDRIKFWEINTMKDLKDFFIYCMGDECKKTYQNLFIDSLTEIGDKLLIELKDSDKYKDPKNTLQMYGKFNDDFTKFIKALRDMKPYNIWFTCLNKYEQDGVEQKETFNFPGAKVKDNVKAWFDEVLKYETFEKDNVKYRKLVTDIDVNILAKDRSGKLKKYEDADLGAIMSKILGVNNEE